MTGGAGFLGSAVSLELARRGASVVAVDNFEEGGGANLANLRGSDVELVRLDLRTADLSTLGRGVDVVFNLAAQTGHLQGQRRPYEDFQINAGAQVRLAAAIRAEAPNAVVVHASTRQVYGRVDRLPVDEGTPTRPPDANAIAKLAGEQYWMLEHRTGGPAVVSLRLTNCYGPRQRIGDAEQSFLGFWIGRALRGEGFPVWGGSQVRDFCHVDDAVAALIAAADAPACRGGVYNVGGASSLSLIELATLLSERTGAAFRVEAMPDAQASIDIGSYVADDRAFRQATGWRPVTPLETGLTDTLDWFRAHASDYLEP